MFLKTKKTLKAVTFMAILSPLTANANPNIDVILAVNSKYFNLPKSLVLGVAKVESNFNANVTGRYRPDPEVGLFQLQTRTARSMGHTGTRKALYNPHTNAYYGIKHLEMAYKKCGSISGAAKLHNAGLASSCNASNYSHKVIAAGNKMLGYKASYSITPQKNISQNRDFYIDAKTPVN